MKIIRKRFVYVCKTSGHLKESDFMLVTEEIDTNDLKEYGRLMWSESHDHLLIIIIIIIIFYFAFVLHEEILCEAMYLGMDAGLRAYLNMVPPGITMIGGQVAKYGATRNSISKQYVWHSHWLMTFHLYFISLVVFIFMLFGYSSTLE